MKITDQHVQYMRDKIKPLDTQSLRKTYAEGRIENADKVKDLDKRYRWDLLWAAGLSDFLVKVIYKYAHDDHIDTALKAIVPKLEKTDDSK